MRANPLKIGPRTPPGVHPAQFFIPDPFLTAPGPENGPRGAKRAKNLPEPVVGHLSPPAGSK